MMNGNNLMVEQLKIDDGDHNILGLILKISFEDGCQTRAAITSDNITVVFVTTTCVIIVVIIPLETKIAICNRLGNDKRLNHLLLDKS